MGRTDAGAEAQYVKNGAGRYLKTDDDGTGDCRSAWRNDSGNEGNSD